METQILRELVQKWRLRVKEMGEETGVDEDFAKGEYSGKVDGINFCCEQLEKAVELFG